MPPGECEAAVMVHVGVRPSTLDLDSTEQEGFYSVVIIGSFSGRANS